MRVLRQQERGRRTAAALRDHLVRHAHQQVGHAPEGSHFSLLEQTRRAGTVAIINASNDSQGFDIFRVLTTISIFSGFDTISQDFSSTLH